ncbi:hypothetical protein [Duganella vulcania]|uniref:Uncharacterized protein n=1 Tax=Duganella vulcania TaxID=2692166 RepID=A0A845GI93_9BURK|nr:hypothetical protein [Duganella vulcania]MYM92487.1 hypothetical protein [Duganella vulcania]
MNTYLVVALVVTLSLLVATLRFTYKRCAMYEDILRATDTNGRFRAMDREYMELRRRMGVVVRVVNSSVGGIGKRLSESVEIATAIHTQAPQIFSQCEGLARWLRANDQFLVELYSAISYAVDPDVRERFEGEVKGGREVIFEHVYDATKRVPPPMTSLFGRSFACESDRQIAHQQLRDIGYQGVLAVIGPIIAEITYRHPAPAPMRCNADDDSVEADMQCADRALAFAAVATEQAREAKVAAARLFAEGAVAASVAMNEWAYAKEGAARTLEMGIA